MKVWPLTLLLGCTLACTGGPSGEELWREVCDPGQIPETAPADLRSTAYARVYECRMAFAHIGAIDPATTDAIARCAIKMRGREDADERALLDCLPKRMHADAKALLVEAERFRGELYAFDDDDADDEPAAAPGLSPAEQRLESEGVRGESLALQLCGDKPVKARPYEDFVRRSIWRSNCRRDTKQLHRNDARAAELISVCVLELRRQLSADVDPSAEQLAACLPADVHPHIEKIVRQQHEWRRPRMGEVEHIVASLEADDRASAAGASEAE